MILPHDLHLESWFKSLTLFTPGCYVMHKNLWQWWCEIFLIIDLHTGSLQILHWKEKMTQISWCQGQKVQALKFISFIATGELQ